MRPTTSRIGSLDRSPDVTVQPFESVVDEHGPVVCACAAPCWAPADAEDAWSETFLSALRAYPDLRPDSDVRAWLVTIAHRKAIDQIRRPQRRARPADRSLPEQPSTRRHPPTPTPTSATVRARRRCRPSSAAPWPTTTSPGCPTPRSASCSGSTEAAARRSAADGIANLRNDLSDGPGDERPGDERPPPRHRPGRRPARPRMPIRRPASSTPCVTVWPTTPTARACSTSPTAPSTARSGRCCWRPPPRAWCGWPSSARTTTPCSTQLAAAVSPRILRSPPHRRRRPPARRVLRRPAPGVRRCPSTCGWSHGFRRSVISTTSRHPLRRHRELRRRRRRGRQPERGAGRRAPPAPTTPCPSSCPCHRVVRSDGTIGEYLGGAEAKAALLALEAAA